LWPGREALVCLQEQADRENRRAMRGIVVEQDEGRGGRIRGTDGEEYAFSAQDVRSGAHADENSKVDFIARDGRAADIYVIAPPSMASLMSPPITMTEADRIKARPSKSVFAYFRDCVFEKYAVFSGRARRAEFFSFGLVAFLIGVLALAADLFFFSDLSLVLGDGDLDLFEQDLFMPLTGAAIFLLLLPGAAVSVRRLHDQKMTGWIFLLVLAVPVGPLILFIVMLFDGFKSANRYGPSPKYALPESVTRVFA
jgi:uncharacterized membrane protein YhaH (DUF805 family)